MKKIIVTGFPHTGTTILKNIIGHIPDVKELIHEEKLIRQYDEDHTYKWNLCKWPFANDEYFTEQFDDYIKIFVIRNPLWIFSSLNKRCAQDDPPGIPPNHDVNVYKLVCERYLRCLRDPEEDIYIIKYEDMFSNNFECLRNIFDKIGFEYDDSIFQNENYRNFSHRNITEIPREPVDNVDHERYRTWQINQPIRNMNDIEKLDLLDHQIKGIVEDPNIIELYPEIPTILTMANISFNPESIGGNKKHTSLCI